MRPLLAILPQVRSEMPEQSKLDAAGDRGGGFGANFGGGVVVQKMSPLLLPQPGVIEIE